MESPHEVIYEINNLIDTTTLSPEAKRDALWASASVLWKNAFPPEMCNADRQAQWKIILTECEGFGKERQAQILDVLEWPASGKDPAFLPQ